MARAPILIITILFFSFQNFPVFYPCGLSRFLEVLLDLDVSLIHLDKTVWSLVKFSFEMEILLCYLLASHKSSVHIPNIRTKQKLNLDYT